LLPYIGYQLSKPNGGPGEIGMAENIRARVKRIIAGGIADIVDTVETAKSESVMREAIREIDRAIDDARAELARVTNRRLQARRHIDMTRAKLADLADKARTALGDKREDLAEAAITRQVDLEAQVPVLESAMRDAESEQAELERSVAALLGRKHEMETELAAFVATCRSAEREAALPGASPCGVAEKRAETASNAFERAMKGATGLSGVPTSDRETTAKLAELDVVLRQKKIAERLATLRAGA
jgi:phage shock protein A